MATSRSGFGGSPRHLAGAARALTGPICRRDKARLGRVAALLGLDAFAQKTWVTRGFAVVAINLKSKDGLAGYLALEPLPKPTSSQEWAMLLDCALNERIFEEKGRSTTTVPAMDFLGWLIDAMPLRQLQQLKRDHPVILERFSDTTRVYVQRTHDPNAPAPGGYPMGLGHRRKQSLDQIYDAFVSGRWAGGGSAGEFGRVGLV